MNMNKEKKKSQEPFQNGTHDLELEWSSDGISCESIIKIQDVDLVNTNYTKIVTKPKILSYVLK